MTVPSPTKLDASGLQITVVVSRFNSPITEKLLEACCETLREHGCGDESQRIVFVPGAFELPLACQALIRNSPVPDAIVALGSVIRGQTAHFDFLCQEATRGLGDVALRHHLPIADGILTTENPEQAMARCGGVKGNRGRDAALVAIEMANLLRGA